MKVIKGSWKMLNRVFCGVLTSCLDLQVLMQASTVVTSAPMAGPKMRMEAKEKIVLMVSRTPRSFPFPRGRLTGKSAEAPARTAKMVQLGSGSSRARTIE